MKKTKIIFSILISIIMLVSMASVSKAVTASIAETPTSVTSGSEFILTIKFDEAVNQMNAHLEYDDSLISIVGASEPSNLNVSGYGTTTNVASIVYTNMDTTTKADTFKIKVKATDVTEDKVAKFKIKDFAVVLAEDNSDKILDNVEFSVTITASNPGDGDGSGNTGNQEEITVSTNLVELKKGESKTVTVSGGVAPITWTSSNETVAKVDSNGKITAIAPGTTTILVSDANGSRKEITVKVTADTTIAPTDHAKTGENMVLLAVVIIALAIVVTLGIHNRKMSKLFVMLPLLTALSLSANKAEAKIIIVDKGQTGIISNLEELNGKKAIGVVPDEEKFEASTESKLYKDDMDFNGIFGTESTNVTITTANGATKNSSEALVTGDIIKNDNEEYTLIIYGDANSDGIICFVSDINVIVNDFIKKAEATGASRVAANLRVDNTLNVFDISRMVQKFQGKNVNTIISENPFELDEAVFAMSTDNGTTWQEYNLFSEAVTAAGNTKAQIKVLSDFSVIGDSTEIGENQDITVELNGKEVGIGTFDIALSGKLTIQDSVGGGTFSRGTPDFIEMKTDTAVLTINGGTVSCSSNTIFGEKGNVIINDGALKSTAGTINANNVTVNDGSVTASSSYAIKANNLLVKGGNIEGDNTAIIVKTATIEGGTISSEKAGATIQTSETLSITGGTITKTSPMEGAPAYAVRSTGGNINITGGTITGPYQVATSADQKYCAVYAENANITVSDSAKIQGGSGSNAAIYQDGTDKTITINGGIINSGYHGQAAIYQNTQNGKIEIRNGSITGYKNAIYQEQGNNIEIWPINGTQNITITQSDSIAPGDGQNTSGHTAIYKASAGNIIVGNSDDTVPYGEEHLKIDGDGDAVYAPEATLEFNNGFVTGGVTMKDFKSNNNLTLASDITVETDSDTNLKTISQTLRFVTVTE